MWCDAGKEYRDMMDAKVRYVHLTCLLVMCFMHCILRRMVPIPHDAEHSDWPVTCHLKNNKCARNSDIMLFSAECY